MEEVRKHLLVLVFLCLLWSPSARKADKMLRPTRNFELTDALYVFGDSTVDAGNNKFIERSANVTFLPYGIDFPDGPTGRFTNGKTSADILAEFLGLPIPPPFLSLSESEKKNRRAGINFASGGCGILPKTKPLRCLSLSEQVQHFNSTVWHLNALDRIDLLADAVFFISMGANDYIFSYFSNPEQDAEVFALLLAVELEECMNNLHRLGASTFVVNNIGPIGCIPENRNEATGECDEKKNEPINVHNNNLAKILGEMAEKLTDSRFFLADSHGLFYEILASPGFYGINETRKACCGEKTVDGRWECKKGDTPCINREEYLFFDGVHFSEVANRYFAWKCIEGVYCT
ncbi:GDSL esterase/lipase At1g71691-like [Actinidia eriantha]|uniref:GDSL esterase/lipase At1g71691-like n=1 Tax=Actinidia eriantha TaxID=165200 RepID=UPI0025854148|nr:GDSL esterase/lipase At1g71691-like [Actinidia eriantha]